MGRQFSVKANAAKSRIKDFQNLLQPVIDSYFEEHISQVTSNFGSYSLQAVDVLKSYMTRNAKRLRGSFVYHTYKMFGGDDEPVALQTALAIELVHSYLLIVDDFMDRSAERRGGITAHGHFSEIFKKDNFHGNDPVHFGESVAVNTGLIGSHMAMQIILSLNSPDGVKIRLLQNLNEKIEKTCYGQIVDVFNAVVPQVSEEEVMNMLHWKTGIYTYENPIHSGAILSQKAGDKDLEVLSRFAIPAGIAFQIRDDILGMFGDSREMGKSNMDDLKEGKMTLLIQKALEQGSEAQKKVILGSLGNDLVTKEEHLKVQEVIRQTGALDYSLSVSQNLVEKAKSVLIYEGRDDWETDHLDYLLGISDYMIERIS